MTEQQAREFLERELAKQESAMFYWENEELEEALEFMIEAVAKLIAANNAKVETDRRDDLRRAGF
jgi:hypothetical protein